MVGCLTLIRGKSHHHHFAAVPSHSSLLLLFPLHTQHTSGAIPRPQRFWLCCSVCSFIFSLRGSVARSSASRFLHTQVLLLGGPPEASSLLLQHVSLLLSISISLLPPSTCSGMQSALPVRALSICITVVILFYLFYFKIHFGETDTHRV